VEAKKILSSLSTSDQALIPSNSFLLQAVDCEYLMSLEDFLEVYKDPITVDLESERVWPIHPLFTY